MISPSEGLLVDIDDTLTRFKAGSPTRSTSSLLQVFRQAGSSLAGLSDEEAARRIEHVQKTVRWWCWDDFIRELGLDSAAFWDFAYEVERQYLEPTEPDIAASLGGLKALGLKLFVTSNNPNPGIRHKLRLAGVEPSEVDKLFDGLLGATALRAMKKERTFWERAVARSGLAASVLATVGDDLNDDYETPRAAGLGFAFLVDPRRERRGGRRDGLIPVDGIGEVLRLLA